MTEIYYIGGSPCAGKSTVAEMLSKKYSLYYFKADDFLETYMKAGASQGDPICKKNAELDAEQIWMRDPGIQCQEEFAFYNEIFGYLSADLAKLSCKNGIVTEGAAYVPALMQRAVIPYNRYIAVTPTEDFQIFHYKQRDFVSYVLQGCTDQEKAFANWMKRDLLFAKEVQKQCLEAHYASIVNDGSIDIDEFAKLVAVHFGLCGC